MNVLIACEESQTVCKAFRENGHKAFSLDILPCSGGRPDWHIQADLFHYLRHIPDGYFNLIGLHYPCTKVALCGNKHYGKGKPKHNERLTDITITKNAWDLAKRKSKSAYYENPKNVMGAYIGKRTQAIHPYQFGHPEQKETWLWLYNLPLLVETDNVYDQMMVLPKNQRERIFHMAPSDNRGQERSKTYPGIAAAMATQWSNL